jgi:hypothetical protein
MHMLRFVITAGLSLALGTLSCGVGSDALAQKALPADPVTSAMSGAKIVPFSKGLGQIAVPPGYEVSYSAEGGLQLIEKQAKNLRIYADFHAGPGKNGPPDLGHMFVRKQAKDKGLKVEEVADRVMMVDPGPNTKMDGKIVLNVHRVIGFGQSIVVLSTAIHEDQMQSPQVKKFFAEQLEQMILSLAPGNGKKS